MILDVETTGVNRHADRIIEIAVIMCGGREVFAALSTFVNPTYDFGMNAFNGIMYTDCSQSPTFAELAPFLYSLICLSDEVVAYNAPFDVGMLAEEFARCGLRMPKRPVVDAMKPLGRMKLVDACRRMRVPTDDLDLHRALGDVIATYRLFCVLRLAAAPDSEEAVTLGVRLA